MKGAGDGVGRLPDFLVIGAMKAATTSLFRWLDAHPATAMPSVKEPCFFAHEDSWRRGMGWYRGHFPVLDGTLTGEASVSYTDPERSEASAGRIEKVLPRARLVFVARDPAARARSHYLHAVRRARETRPFPGALSIDSRYVQRSCYHICLEPYLRRPARDRLLVVRYDDLVGPEDTTWLRVLRHIGLDPCPRPEVIANQGDVQPQWSAGLRMVKDRGLVRHIARLPTPVRRVGRQVLLRDAKHTSSLVESVTEAIPEAIEARWREDAARLATDLGRRPT